MVVRTSEIEIEVTSDAKPKITPAGAITNLLKDSSLVKKWSQVQQFRYGSVFAGMTCCCSTSSCIRWDATP